MGVVDQQRQRALFAEVRHEPVQPVQHRPGRRGRRGLVLARHSARVEQRSGQRRRAREQKRAAGAAPDRVAQQLADNPECERALKLGTPSLSHRHPGGLGLRPCVRKERRLAEPGRAFHVSQTPVARARPLDERLDALKLPFPLEDPGAVVSCRGKRAGFLHQTIELERNQLRPLLGTNAAVREFE